MTSKKPRIQTASLRHEREYAALGLNHIIGMDEAGRGPWAGPIVVGAVCLPLDRTDLSRRLAGVRDSKQLSAPQRDELAARIREVALAWGLGSASAELINEEGINGATRAAMSSALDDLLSRANFTPDCLFLDYVLWPERRDIPQVSIVGGDERSLTIAAASILAKTWRDEQLMEMDAEFPQYGFAQHKGYGTPTHRRALEQFGPSPVHRLNYKPVQDIIRKAQAK